ncbi:MAG: SMC family ATPase, partial [Candidatus Dependentiae bacterium]|nr:SMC family ATPase [Candidatus Dependentiae bacterium]
MIPLTLQIKNFLSYGPELQTVNFGPYPLICLSGKNGHGKSALLDAITWALWGQARKTLGMVKPDQGLLRLGQTHMMVIFDFELGGSTYRVRREFSVTYGKPTAQLEFGMLNKETQKLIPLTSKTIRNTQEIIEQTIHIDFESFTNSAFLRQGNANEFSKKSSKDRKEILASILGLGRYDLIRKRAMDKARTAAAQKQTMLALQEKLMGEIQKKASLALQLETITQQLTAICQIEQHLDIQAAKIEQSEKDNAQEQQDASLVLFKVQELVKKQHEDRCALQEKYSTWRTVHKKQLYVPDYSALQNQKRDIMAAIAIFQQKLQKQLEIKMKHVELTSQLHAHTQQLNQTHVLAVQKTNIDIERIRIELANISENKKRLEEQKISHEKEISQCRHALDSVPLIHTDIVEIELKKAESLFERRKEYYQIFRTRGSLIHSELQNSIQKQQLVHDKEDPSCPLCEQNLSALQRRFLQQKFTRTEHFLTHQQTRLLHVVKKLKDMLITQHEHIQQLHSTIQKSIAHKLQQAEIAKNSQKIELSLALIMQQLNMYEHKEQDLGKNLVLAQKQYELFDRKKIETISTDPRYQQLTASINTLEHELATIIYTKREHEDAQKRLQEIETLLSEYEHIQQESVHQEQRKKEVFYLCHTLRNLKAQITDLMQAQHKYNDLTEKITLLVAEKKALADARKKYMQEKELILQEKGSIHIQQENLKLIESEHAQNLDKIKEYDTAMIDYHAIAIATGKDGIQALLIEDAIPEIEQEANELLKKLTNNQAHIFIESLRDLKKGGTKETLDINISDATGIRPYELFSGGEAFRIDFALRIAISKLLARRAGTALQTLIIDEGFGSQDEEGLGLIMDALHIIQDDFSKVIIVSHLNAMKDQFPVHFVVEK